MHAGRLVSVPRLLSIAAMLMSQAALVPGIRAAETASADPYLAVVRAYADALITQGTDVYGEQRSHMILSLMDRKTLTACRAYPRGPEGVRNSDRVTLHGSNVNLDTNLYRVLYGLSELTGDQRYATAADAALTDFLTLTPSPETKLLAWGEHTCWDLLLDGPGSTININDSEGNFIKKKYIHEPKRPTVLFDRFYELNPAATLAYTQALWDHQVHNHQDGNFSRHTDYMKHAPRYNEDFPKEAGYLIHDWARSYNKTKDGKYLTYINVMAKRYLKKLDKNKWNIIPFDGTRNFSCTSANLSLAIDAHKAAQFVGGETKHRLLQLSARIDQGILALPHDISQGGFVEFVSTIDYSPYPHKKNNGINWTWEMKYGRKTTAMVGVLFFSRAAQLERGPAAQGYRTLALQAADLYLDTAPDMSTNPWPVELGIVSFLEMAAYDATKEQRYLDRATFFADLGLQTYWDSSSPLPKADVKARHYENITRADTLVYALLRLAAIRSGRPSVIAISDIDR